MAVRAGKKSRNNYKKKKKKKSSYRKNRGKNSIYKKTKTCKYDTNSICSFK